MEKDSHSAQTTASLVSARSLLECLDAQRTALLAHEPAVLVHSIAVQNLVDYPAAATISFSSNHPTSLTMELVLDVNPTALDARSMRSSRSARCAERINFCRFRAETLNGCLFVCRPMEGTQNLIDVIDGEPQRVLGSDVVGDLPRLCLLPKR